MTGRRVYISGPMTGYPEHNYPAFNDAERLLEIWGHIPLNPARHPDQACWADYLRLDLVDVASADGIATLPGWQESRGAQLEIHVAHALGILVLPIDHWRGGEPECPSPHDAMPAEA